LSTEIFDSAVRSRGDLAGVFEYDGETAYFYLYDQRLPKKHLVVDAIRITSRQPDFGKADIRVEWDSGESNLVCLLEINCGRPLARKERNTVAITRQNFDPIFLTWSRGHSERGEKPHNRSEFTLANDDASLAEL
jgi:hypothetical protein